MSIVGWGRLLKTLKELKKYDDLGHLEVFCNVHGLDYHFYKRYLKTNFAIISGDSELLEAIKSDKELSKKLSEIYTTVDLS